jgi:hypothetical protein
MVLADNVGPAYDTDARGCSVEPVEAAGAIGLSAQAWRTTTAISTVKRRVVSNSYHSIILFRVGL